MPLYTVTWDIDIDAETPKEAARKALAIQRDAGAVWRTGNAVTMPVPLEIGIKTELPGIRVVTLFTSIGPGNSPELPGKPHGVDSRSGPKPSKNP